MAQNPMSTGSSAAAAQADPELLLAFCLLELGRLLLIPTDRLHPHDRRLKAMLINELEQRDLFVATVNDD